MSFLLTLLGLSEEDAESVSGASFLLRPTVPWAAIIVAAVLLILFAYFLYRSTPRDVKPGRRRLLTALRILFFLLLLGILLRPMLKLSVDREARRTVVTLVDSSESMSIADPRDKPDDRARAAIARGELAADAGLGSAPGTASEPITREDLASEVLGNEKLNLLPQLREKADVAAYQFGAGIQGIDLESTDTITPDSPSTAIGDALREVLRRRGAEDLAAIFLISDGVSNDGPSPLASASALRDRGIPIYAYGTGVTDSKDIAVAGIEMPDVALAEDGVSVAVLVDGRGVREGETGKLTLKLGGTTVAEKEFTFTGKGEQKITAYFVPTQVGEYAVEASVEGGGGEVLSDNNVLSQNIRVIDSAIRVLMVEQAPRWEFQYLREMLLRERRIELKIFLADADPEVARAPGSPYIEEFPNRREDLFKYDLVIFGDVDPATVDDSQRDMLASFVADGGGSLIMLAGRRFNPSAYRGSSLASLLPVELSPTSLTTDTPAATKPILPVLTEAGKASPMLSLEETEELNLTRWSELPPIYWIADVDRAKPAAEVLLSKEDPASPEATPIIALQRYGTGEVLFVGSDNFWRWRKNAGDEFHTILWGQIVQRMAGRRLAVGDRKADLKADKRTVGPDERVTVFARLLGDDFFPRTDSTVRAVLEPVDGEGLPREVTLRAVPGTPGYYRAEFTETEEGNYRLRLPGSGSGDGGEVTTGGGVDITVRSRDKEFDQTAMNASLLRELAESTGGAFLREEDLYKLPGLLAVEPRILTTFKEVDLWSSPLYFILLLIPLTMEWFLRKWSELK